MNLVTSAAMNIKRVGHSLTRLGGGGLLLAVGGQDALGNVLASAEIFNPATNTWTLCTAALAVARYNHAAVAVGGTVCIIGGQGNGGGFLSSVEIFQSNGRPDTLGTFAAAASGLVSARANMRAELLADGRIAVSGGADTDDVALSISEIYAPGI